MDAPPWHDSDEPDFMARVRTTFVQQLPLRMQEVATAIAALGDPATEDHRPAAEQLMTAVHNLAGTAETVGAEEMGAISSRMSGVVRGWLGDGDAPAPEAVADISRDARELKRTAEQFYRWMDWSPE